ncbi:MAG: FMN-binding negative transcriptional regulator [Alphaproteobacteria bacterium]
MHPNPAYRRQSQGHALDFALERGFGALTVASSGAGPEEVLAAHVPFVIEGDVLSAHLVRSNPLARHLARGPATALMMVCGPDGYISPDWYGEPDRVPTWNYLAVHLRGQLRLVDEAGLRACLDRLAARFESRLAPKAPWKADKMTPDVLARLLRQIVPVEMTVETVDSTFKLNQNGADSARLGAAAGLAAGGTPGMETGALAVWMRGAGVRGERGVQEGGCTRATGVKLLNLNELRKIG